MQLRESLTRARRRAVLLVCVAGLVLFAISSAARNEYGPTSQQEVIRLENRITQLEQRLFSLETSLRTLEQQSRLAGASRGISPAEVALLQSQVQALQHRILEDECGLAKLDERTLARELRDTRKRSSASTDPCRANVDLPLRLPERRQ